MLTITAMDIGEEQEEREIAAPGRETAPERERTLPAITPAPATPVKTPERV